MVPHYLLGVFAQPFRCTVEQLLKSLLDPAQPNPPEDMYCLFQSGEMLLLVSYVLQISEQKYEKATENFGYN